MVSAQITGNALLSYDVIKEDGEWTGELEQNVSLGTRGKVGLDSFLGLNLGIIQRDKKWDLGQLFPIYNLNLQNKYYRLSSGYSVNMYRDITTSRVHENLNVSLPDLPTLRLSYTRQSTRNTPEGKNIDSTGDNVQVKLEDEIGPLRITLDRREYFLTNRVRGPRYDVRSSKTSGNVSFKYFYEKLLSLRGRYRLGLFRTDREMTGKNKENSHYLSVDFRVSPISTVALSGTTSGRLEQRQREKGELSSNSLVNKLHLVLHPVDGVSLSATYFRNDFSRNEDGRSSNESKSLLMNFEPWQNLVLSGNFTIYDSQESDQKLFSLRKNSFYLRAEPIDGIRLLSQLHLSKSDNFANNLNNDRNSLITTLETTPTSNLRTSISHDWQKFREEPQQRMVVAMNYFPVRRLNFNFRLGRDISSEWEGNANFLTCRFNYSIYGSYVNFRYNRSNRPNRSPMSSNKKHWTTQTLTVDLGQKLGLNNDLRLSYKSRISDRELGYRSMNRILFRADIRF